MKGQIIFPWIQWTHQFRDNGEQARSMGKQGFKGAFRSSGRAGNEIDFQVRFLPQAKHRGNGVLLGAADNQPGNEVADAHEKLQAPSSKLRGSSKIQARKSACCS